MNDVDVIRSQFDHVFWADKRVCSALEAGGPQSDEALREYSHIVGAAETWLALIEGRESELPVWPDLSLAELASRIAMIEAGYAQLLAGATSDDLARSVVYTNSAGKEFRNTVGEILTHLALHGQYHRGKVNLLLRQAGADPAPVDFIAFLRGVPAAVRTTGN